MGYNVEIKNDGPTKKIRTFISPDGTVHEGGAETYLGGTGRPNPIPEGGKEITKTKE
jgi:hypothetical protein